MEDRSTRIFGLMYGAYNLNHCDYEESKIVKNEFSEGTYCDAESEKGCAARICILDRLSDGEDDEDVDILVDTNYNIEEYLAHKMYDYAVYYTKKDILYDIFDLMWNYRKAAETCEDSELQIKYTYKANGLMAAAVLVTHSDLEDLEVLYRTHIESKEKDR